MTDFDYDVLQKKRVAQNARHRKCGSKSRYCGLPSDHLTQKQWKERNGQCMTMNLNQPMTWEEFSQLSDSMQKEYLQHIIDTYHVGCPAMGKMFGCSQSNVFRRASQLGVTLTKHNGRQPKSVQENWRQFLGNDPAQEQSASIQESDASMSVPAAQIIVPDLRQTPSPMCMNRFSIQFSGKIDPSMVANSLLHMIGSDTEGDLTVTFSAKSLANS